MAAQQRLSLKKIRKIRGSCWLAAFLWFRGKTGAEVLNHGQAF
jgi:hypothetical protein